MATAPPPIGNPFVDSVPTMRLPAMEPEVNVTSAPSEKMQPPCCPAVLSSHTKPPTVSVPGVAFPEVTYIAPTSDATNQKLQKKRGCYLLGWLPRCHGTCTRRLSRCLA